MPPDTREPLIDLIFDRLAADDVPVPVCEAVLAALAGDEDLAEALAGRPPSLDAGPPADDPAAHPHLYLSSVTVAGFRGVGPRRTLTLRPRPGLTLIVGRNGSGKSSFAEAVELSLTGDSIRWANRTSVWRTGWRNLHTADPCEITTELRIDGTAEPSRVTRSWTADAGLTDARVDVRTPSGRFTDLAALGLDRPLGLYRPFLTAADLSTMLTGNNSELFDSLDAILGLDTLTAADKRLMATTRPHDTALKQLRTEKQTLLAALSEVDDVRADRARTILAVARPDLDQLDTLLAEPLTGDADATVVAARTLADWTMPDPADVDRLAHELHDVTDDHRRHDHTRVDTAIRTAELLRLALDHHSAIGDGSCPVCRTGALDPRWRAGAEATLAELRTSTVAARRTAGRLAELTRQARAVVDALAVPEPAGLDIDVTELHQAIAAARADLTTYPAVAVAATRMRIAAAAWLGKRDTAWRQVADEIRLYIAAARHAPSHERAVALLKNARSWLKTSGEQIRNDRLAPFAAASQTIWRELRQESNVELGAMTLTGTSTRRRVVFPVSVDGADNGTALGVMSQGEMHALALATFLPRSCADESPFRFAVIDDPVQSMDPAKVDGLARVLGRLAEHRQIVVFTHDSRLPDAVRRLNLDNAEIIEVVRAEQSVVTLQPGGDPVTRYLDDANSLARTDGIPEDVRGPVVADLCRCAIEAACHRMIWRNRLARGVPHARIEEAIEGSTRLTTTAALALFDDPDRGGDVLRRLNNAYGTRAGDAYQACQRGVHGGYTGDLTDLVRDTRVLTGKLT
jgi:ABC-type lipoprotein export system ATPase subunit